MGYSANEGMVRADLFKENGKWSQTYALDMSKYYEDPDMWASIRLLYRDQVGHQIPKGWLLVVLEPYHTYSHPVIVRGT